MKILYISKSETADDRTEWSGTVYQTIKALKMVGFQVDHLWALRDFKNTLLDKLMWRYWFFVMKILHKNIRVDDSFSLVYAYRQTLRKINYDSYDVIFIPTHTCMIAALPESTHAKVVHLVDATAVSLFNYYTEFSNLIFHNYWSAKIIGEKAFKRADLIISSSLWCKKNAINQYKCNPNKISVIEFGANIDFADIFAKKRDIDGKKILNIYWSGVNWQRKGGDIAVSCCEELINRGYPVVLNITGMKILPRYVEEKKWVKNWGFFDKNDCKQYNQLVDIMKKQDLFLFPSKAECSSIALCEANAFGLPCFVYDTGGLANYVFNGKNGYRIPLNADAKIFASYIINSINSKELDKLSQGAIECYQTKLNWKSWGERVKESIEKIVKN